jgi:hypothetical protein
MKCFLIIIFSLQFLSSCQVKSKSSSGLISGHKPVSNAFTVNSPEGKIYVSGEYIIVTLSFPFPVLVDINGGTPRLELTIGGTSHYAGYSGGHGTKTISFKYLVAVANNDADGVDLVDLELNGGTLTFDDHGTITNCDTTTVTPQNFSTVLVDNLGPSITGLKLANAPKFYNLGKTLNFILTFNEKVYVTGIPSFNIDFTIGGPFTVTYAGGSGTTDLSFSFTIPDTAADINGYDSISSPLDLNGGAIQDSVGNNSSLDFSGLIADVITYSADVDFDGRLPFVLNLTPPADGSYVAAENLDIAVEFDRAVSVSGSPYIQLSVGSEIRQAAYLSGTDTRIIVFRYTTVPGDIDTDGITIEKSINQNSGDIIGSAAPTNSYFSIIANNVYSVPSTSGILIEAVQPQPISIVRSSDNTIPLWGSTSADDVWIIGQTLTLVVGFNTNMYVGQTNGTPRIPLTIGATTRYATYSSGGDGKTSLIFQYIVQEGDLDTDGVIDIGSIDLNGGTITDALNTNSLLVLPEANLSSTKVDGIRPSISSLTPPPDGTYSTVTGVNHFNMIFKVNWSEAVNYSSTDVNVPLTIGGINTSAVYTSGNNSNSISHNPTSLSGLNDTDGIAVSSPLSMSASIKDQAGNSANNLSFTAPVTTGILVDTTPPTVSSIMPPGDKTYLLSENLDFYVTFSETVTTNVSEGYPRIALTIGSSTKYLIPTVNTTGTAHTFRYTVVNTDNDGDGVAMGTSVESSGTGYIRDAGLNNVSSTFTAPSTPGVLVDALAPSVTSVIKPSNGTYDNPDVLEFSLTFSEVVTVDAIGGTPRIEVGAQTGVLNFNYISGTGTDTLIFRHTVSTSDFDFDGLTSASSITLNGGTIKDNVGNNASTSFTSQDLSNVSLSYPNINIWTDHNLINKAAPNTIPLTSTGIASTDSCGTGTCRIFDGDDSLSISSDNNDVQTVFLLLKTDSVLGTYDLIVNDFTLQEDSIESTFDLLLNGSVTVNGVTYANAFPLAAETNLLLSSTNVIQIDYAATQNYSIGEIIPNTFLGGLGELIMVSGTLSSAEKENILLYLNSKY